jgi:hypothetical protein
MANNAQLSFTKSDYQAAIDGLMIMLEDAKGQEKDDYQAAIDGLEIMLEDAPETVDQPEPEPELTGEYLYDILRAIIIEHPIITDKNSAEIRYFYFRISETSYDGDDAIKATISYQENEIDDNVIAVKRDNKSEAKNKAIEWCFYQLNDEYAYLMSKKYQEAKADGMHPQLVSDVERLLKIKTSKQKKELIEETVKKRLTDAQKNKEFKDTDIVNYTRKYKRSYEIVTLNDLDDIEKDEVNAYDQVEKSKVWPEYDIAQEKEKGYPPSVVYLKVKVREALSVRPFNSKDARNIYVTNINELREILDDCWTYTQIKTTLYSFEDQLLKLFNYARKKMESIFGTRFLNFCTRSSDSAIQSFAQAELYDPYTKQQQNEYLEKELTRNNEWLQKAEQAYNEAEALSNNPDEMINVFKSRFSGGMAGWSKSALMKDIDGVKNVFLAHYKNKLNKIKQTIENLEKREKLPEWNQVREANWNWAFDEKVKKEHKKSKAPSINTKIPLDHIERTGGLKIPAVKVESIVNHFCFNNVTFGTALTDSFSRESVKHFLGSLSDLAELLDLDICAVNKLGKLDIVFAGMGVKGHMATYFSKVKAINLSRRSGDGSVAHEWFHYFDNMCIEGSKRTADERFASNVCDINDSGLFQAFYRLKYFILHGDKQNPSTIIHRFPAQSAMKYNIYDKDNIENAIAKIKLYYPVYKLASSIKRKAIANYYGYIAHHFNLPYIDVEMTLDTSNYYNNSAQIGTNYWIEDEELFARAFEAYIEYKLEKAGRKNNYLVSYKNNWSDWGDKMPYPKGAELEMIVKLFDLIFKEFKDQFNVGEFIPFTTERQDEYVKLDEVQIQNPVIAETDESANTFEHGGSVGTKSYDEIIHSPEFKAWFGDWETAYNSAGLDFSHPAWKDVSKVVDENGEPMVVYHGTNNEFTIFDKSKTRYLGFYFTGHKDYSYITKYTNKTLACFLNLKNPKVAELKMGLGRQYVTHEGKFLTLSFLELSENEYNNIIKLGFDGMIGHVSDSDYNLPFAELIAFNPNQIKLADGSNTTFDGNNPDIRFEDGGELPRNYVAISKLDSLRFGTPTYVLSYQKEGRLLKGKKLTFGWLDSYTAMGSRGKKGWFIADLSMSEDDFNKGYNIESGTIPSKIKFEEGGQIAETENTIPVFETKKEYINHFITMFIAEMQKNNINILKEKISTEYACFINVDSDKHLCIDEYSLIKDEKGQIKEIIAYISAISPKLPSMSVTMDLATNSFDMEGFLCILREGKNYHRNCSF